MKEGEKNIPGDTGSRGKTMAIAISAAVIVALVLLDWHNPYPTRDSLSQAEGVVRQVQRTRSFVRFRLTDDDTLYSVGTLVFDVSSASHISGLEKGDKVEFLYAPDPVGWDKHRWVSELSINGRQVCSLEQFVTRERERRTGILWLGAVAGIGSVLAFGSLIYGRFRGTATVSSQA